MNFTITRKKLVDTTSYTTMILGHHIENATRAKLYADQGKQRMARWYGEQARGDLKSYLAVKAQGKLG